MKKEAAERNRIDISSKQSSDWIEYFFTHCYRQTMCQNCLQRVMPG